MKIALLSTFYPYRGGIAQFGAMLYRALEKDNEVKAFTFTRQYPNFLFPGKTQYVTADDNADPIDAIRVLDTVNPLTYRKTARLINEFEPELLISQYWMTFFGPAISKVHKRVNAKKISIVHNMIPHEKRFFDDPANKMFLKNNDGFVVLSDAVLKDLLSLKPDANYLRIDHPVYDHFGVKLNRDEALEKLGLSKDNKYCLFFGFIRDYKGLDLLIDAISSLPEDYHLIVAGEVYGSFDKYAEQIKAKNLSDRIHLYNDYIPDSEVTLYFSASDVCVLPYKGATQSGITAIAHHFELPLIITDVGGLKENVRHQETGLVVDIPDRDLLSEAIKDYFSTGNIAVMRENIRVEKQENSWDNFAKKIVEFAQTL